MYCNIIHLPLQYTSSPLQYTFISLAIQSHPLHTQVAIQFVYCNTIFFLATAHSCNTILPYCNTLTQPTCKPHCNNSLYCNTIFQPNKPNCNTNSCLAIQLPSQQASSCNTIFQANYTPKVAIQFSYCNTPWIHCTPTKPKSQYKAFYHNTIWAMAQNRFCTSFFFFTIIFFSH